jgi:hypothetical protein
VANFIADVLDSHGDAAAIARTAAAVKALCAKFPVYGPAMQSTYGYAMRTGDSPGFQRVTSR